MSRRSPGVLWLMNFSDGGVFETTRRFHPASAAFIHPARSPTRGSGLGGVMDRSGDGAGVPPVEEYEEEHAAANTNANARDNLGARAMELPVEDAKSARSSKTLLRSGNLDWGCRELGQHEGHALDLGDLVDVDVGSKLEDIVVLRRSGRAK